MSGIDTQASGTAQNDTISPQTQAPGAPANNNIRQNDTSAGAPRIPLTNDEKGLMNLNTVKETLFIQAAVKRMGASDFVLNSKELVTLKWDDCILILFYTENTESIKLMSIWAEAAKQIAGPIFAGVNLLYERQVAEAFTRLNMEDTPLRWAALRQSPFILVYRNGWPVAFYNGDRSVQSIIDYALTLACDHSYYEINQIPASMQAEDNFEIGGWTQYTPKRKTSLEYRADKPIRGYNNDIGIVVQGSAAEQQLEPGVAARALSEAASQGDVPVVTGFEQNNNSNLSPSGASVESPPVLVSSPQQSTPPDIPVPNPDTPTPVA